jgi:hypothetical protein
VTPLVHGCAVVSIDPHFKLTVSQPEIYDMHQATIAT